MNSNGVPLVIDTTKALQALVDAIGGSYRECARVMGCGHTHLWGVLNGKRPPATLDTIVRYAARTQIEAGISMSVLVTHDQQVRYQIKAA
jgi:transcriptional regulator with XRE-family HTH domain